MVAFDWKAFLTRWSGDILDSRAYDHLLTADAYVERWLGEAGATDEQLATAEARLQVKLPPSYRAFLGVTNGWALTTPQIGELWSADDIERFAKRHPGYARSAKHLRSALEISDVGESALYLLNPAIIDLETGEWEAWIFDVTEAEGRRRYPSFQALMEAEYQNFATDRPHHMTYSVPQPVLEPFDWRMFLTKFSEEMLAGEDFLEEFEAYLTPEQIATRWLGFTPASEEQIAAAEARLRLKLPPSYREFLKVTNGWSVIEPFIYRVYPVEEIGYGRDNERLGIADYIEGYSYGIAPGSPSAADLAYADELHSVIAVSEYGDAALLLNPKQIDDEGEMEAWFFASWVPGENRYPSFRALMEAKYWSFLDIRADVQARRTAESAPPDSKQTMRGIAAELESRAQAMLDGLLGHFKPSMDALKAQMRQNPGFERMMRFDEMMKSLDLDPDHPETFLEAIRKFREENPGLERLPTLSDEERTAVQQALLRSTPNIDLDDTMSDINLILSMQQAARQIQGMFGTFGTDLLPDDLESDAPEDEEEEQNPSHGDE